MMEEIGITNPENQPLQILWSSLCATDQLFGFDLLITR